MTDLADDLRAYLEHRVVSAYETGAFAEMKKWVQRNKGLASAAAALIVVLAGATVVVANKNREVEAKNAEIGQKAAVEAKNVALGTANENVALGGEHRDHAARRQRSRPARRSSINSRVSCCSKRRRRAS
jgi:negative regulator of sigma E activity